jgi:hypothetical protein
VAWPWSGWATKAAAPALAQVLASPACQATSTTRSTPPRPTTPNTQRYLNAVHTRRESLRELLLARALYRLGDHQGIGEAILRAYTTDLRGHLARHAQAVLDE